MNKDRLLLLAVIVALLLLGVLTIRFFVPWANERFVVWSSEKLTEALGTEASISAVSLTGDGKIVVKDLWIQDPLGQDRTFFYSPRVEVSINPMTVVQEGINLSRVYIKRPLVYIYRREDGKWNVQNFGRKDKSVGAGVDGEPREEKEESQEEKKGSPFRLRIHEVVLEKCVTELNGVFGEDIVTVLDHTGGLEITGKKADIYLWETHFNSSYLTLTDMDVAGKLIYDDKLMSFENFVVRRDSTDIHLEGSIDFEGRDTIDLDIARSRYDLSHIPPRYGLRHKVSGMVDLEATLTGFLNSPEITARVHNAEGMTFNYPYSNLSCLFHLGDGVIDVTELSTDFLGGTMEGEVSFFLRESPKAFRVDLDIAGLDITRMPLNIPGRFHSDFSGQVVAYGSGFSRDSHSSTILLDLGKSTFRGTGIDLIQAQVLARGEGFHVISSHIELDEGLVELTGELGFAGPDIEVYTESVPIPVLRSLIDMTYEIDGNLYGSVFLQDSYSKPSVAGRVVVRDGDVYGWKFAGLEGDIDIRQTDGTVEGFLDMNAFMLKRGWLRSEEAGMRAVFDREGIEFESLTLRMGDSTFVDGTGRLEYAGDRIRIFTDSLNLVYRDLELSVPVLSSELDWEKKEFEIQDLQMDVGGGTISVRGEMAFPRSIEFDGEVRSVRLDALDALVPNGYGIDGRLDLKVNVTNSLEDPEIELSGSIRNPVIKGAWADSIVARASYADSRLQIERASIDGGGHKVDVNGSLPIALDLYPFRVAGIDSEDVDVRIDLDAFALPALRILTDEVDFIEGVVEGDIRLGGVLANPLWNGSGRLRNGEGVVNLTNTYFNRMGMNVSFDGDRIEVSDITAWLMGEGDLAGLGTIWMKGIYPDSIEFALVAEDYMVNQIRHVSTLIFDSDLTVTGKIDHPKITGDVVVHHGVLDIPVSGDDTGREEEKPVPFELQLDVEAKNDLWIRNSDMNVEISLDMDMVTREGKIKPIGDVDVIRGTYTYFGTIFDIREGEINFFGSHPIDPALNVLTTRTIRGRILEDGGSRQVNNEFHLTVYGTYRDVEFDIVVYDANGEIIPIDRQRAMTLLLANMTNEEFDQQAAPNQQRVIGQIEGILAQQTSSLIQPVSKLDVLELRTNLFSGDAETGRAQVTVGEYLMEDFFVSYSQDILDPSINNIAVEVYLGRKSSVVGQTDSKGRQYSVELRYRMSY